MSELPKGWYSVDLIEIADLIRGVSYKKEEARNFQADGYIPILRATNITGSSLSFDGLVYVPSGNVSVNQLLNAGDVVIASSSGSKEIVGKAGSYKGGSFHGAFGAFCTGIRVSAQISSDYFGYFFQAPAYRKSISESSAGSNINNLKSSDLATQKIPVPPRLEQTRIVEKFEELLSDLDAGVAELKAAQKKLKQYRQSLLKAAVEGTLTAEWREEQRKRHSTPLSPRGRGAGGEGIQALNTSDAIWFRDRARQLRQEQTPMEQWLWQQLRAKRFSGFKFRRQQTIGRYIVDFVCFARKLIIELDGGQHADAQEEDAARDHWLRGEGFRVLRFWNNELQQQTDAVLEAIWRALQEPPLPNPSPTRGEGLKPKPARNCCNASCWNAATAGKKSNSPNSRNKAKPRPRIGKTNTPNRCSRISPVCRNCRRGGCGRVCLKRDGWIGDVRSTVHETRLICTVDHIRSYRLAIFVIQIRSFRTSMQRIARRD